MSMLLHPAAVMQLQKDSFHGAIESLNQAAGLQHCWDVANGQSYDGSSQTWIDTVGGYDLYRGPNGTATAADPTFNGSVDARDNSAYWSFDGGDYFTPLAGTGGNTFFNSIHKNNAIFSLACWIRFNANGSNQYIIGSSSGSTIGFGWGMASAGSAQRFLIGNGSTQSLSSTSSSGALPTGTWLFLGVAVDEGATTGVHHRNGVSDNFTSTYTSPSASNNASGLAVAAINAVPQLPLGNAARLANLTAWNRALSSADFDAIFERTRGKFGV